MLLDNKYNVEKITSSLYVWGGKLYMLGNFQKETLSSFKAAVDLEMRDTRLCELNLNLPSIWYLYLFVFTLTRISQTWSWLRVNNLYLISAFLLPEMDDQRLHWEKWVKGGKLSTNLSMQNLGQLDLLCICYLLNVDNNGTDEFRPPVQTHISHVQRGTCREVRAEVITGPLSRYQFSVFSCCGVYP